MIAQGATSSAIIDAVDSGIASRGPSTPKRTAATAEAPATESTTHDTRWTRFRALVT